MAAPVRFTIPPCLSASLRRCAWTQQEWSGAYRMENTRKHTRTHAHTHKATRTRACTITHTHTHTHTHREHAQSASHAPTGPAFYRNTPRSQSLQRCGPLLVQQKQRSNRNVFWPFFHISFFTFSLKNVSSCVTNFWIIVLLTLFVRSKSPNDCKAVFRHELWRISAELAPGFFIPEILYL